MSSKSSSLPNPTPFKKVKWSDAEDKLLIVNVAQNGNFNWSAIASGMPGRTGKQCRERWINRLDPRLNQESWTPEEDAILLCQQKGCGNCWAKIAQFLPGRSPNGAKNRWCWLTRHRNTSEDVSTRKAQLPPITLAEWTEAVDICGSTMWLKMDFESSDEWEQMEQKTCDIEKMRGCEAECRMMSWQ
jgi:hypothetical protein